jgi:hypothetical protein
MRRIEEAFDRWDRLALFHQKRRKRFGFFVALLSPLAVVLLTVSILAVPPASVPARILIAVEWIGLAGALALGFLESRWSPNTWMRERLRAEVLRREKYLLLARVGPYLMEQGLMS